MLHPLLIHKLSFFFSLFLKDCSEFLVRVVVLLWYFCLGGGRVPVSDKVSEGGYEYFAKVARRVGYPFFTLTLKKTDHGKIPL